MRDVELLQWMTSSGKRLRLGSGEVADGGGWGYAAGAERLWRPGISSGEKEVMGGGNHDLGTRLSNMQGVLQKYPHRFELAALLAKG